MTQVLHFPVSAKIAALRRRIALEFKNKPSPEQPYSHVRGVDLLCLGIVLAICLGAGAVMLT